MLIFLLLLLLQLPRGESAKSGSDKAVTTEFRQPIFPLVKGKQPNNPFAELIEQIQCTCIADTVFTLARLFALSALMPFTKNIQRETPL